MSLILILFVHLSLFWILGAIFQAAWLLMLRVKVTAVSLFLGRTPLKFSILGCAISLGWLPMGSSVSFDPAEFQRKSWPTRLLAHASSTLVGLLTAIAMLGWPDAWHHFATGFRQIAEGAWEPIATAREHLNRWQLVAPATPATAFGILAAKCAAMTLLPLGGGVLTQILADAGASTGKESLEKLAVYNAVMGFMIFALWAFAALSLAFVG